MNLMSFLSRGAAHAPDPVAQATEATRAKWLNALLVDETRAWMSVGHAEDGVIEGMTTMLAIAGFAHVHDAKSADTADLRIIRGAISAAAQCQAAGGVVSAADARAFSSAANRAREIIQRASVEAIIHAAQAIRQTVNLPAEAA